MPKRRRQPVRTCIACREEAGKAALIRVVRRPDGSAAFDPTGHAPGRGAYLHRDPACIALARRRRNLERSLGVAMPQELWSELA